MKGYFFGVVVRTIIVSIVSYLLCYYTTQYVTINVPLVNLFVSGVISFILTSITIYTLGINRNEQKALKVYVIKKITSLRKYKEGLSSILLDKSDVY